MIFDNFTYLGRPLQVKVTYRKTHTFQKKRWAQNWKTQDQNYICFYRPILLQYTSNDCVLGLYLGYL